RADILAAEKSGTAKAGAVSARGSGGAPRSERRGDDDPFPWRSVLDKSALPADSTVALSNMRATIARRLVESKTTIPHFYLEIEVDAAPLAALRNQLNLGLGANGVKLSVNHFVLKASAAALRAVPRF